MPEPIIKIENLSKKYLLGSSEPYYSLRDKLAGVLNFKKTAKKRTEFWALKDINLTINRGEAVGIIGRNGAGKSTLLKVLSRITPPTTGRVSLKGRVASLLEVGTGFHPELTGRENIYLNGAILGMKKAEIKKKFKEIVAFSEIEKFLDTPVKRYSSGMYVRLAFAVAAHLEPEILIVDEVLAVGDAQFQKKCLGKMSEVGKSGRTVIFVSHNMAAVNELCEKCILLDRGKIIAEGETSQVIGQYLNNSFLSQEGDIDLKKSDLRVNSIDESIFKFTRLKLLDSRGKTTSSVAFKEPFSLEIEGFLTQKIDDLNIAFSIDSSMGFPLFNSFNREHGLSMKYDPGEVKLKVEFEQNILAPGMYNLSLGANGRAVQDWIPQAISLNIEPVAKDGRNINTDHGGVIVYPCKWSRS